MRMARETKLKVQVRGSDLSRMFSVVLHSYL